MSNFDYNAALISGPFGRFIDVESRDYTQTGQRFIS
ncbi:MAG: hypothetical protein ACI9JN_000529 [Bacteroidia bacterium]|jgi:hypothetical protein